MKVQDCFTGQRVINKENGNPATVRRIYGSSGELELAFDNGSTAKAHARLVEPAEASPETESGPMRPCPQCATKMSIDATVCPSCGFEYGVKRAPSRGSGVKILIIAIVVMVIAYVIWKYALK